jgi:hypothetical protein
MLKRLLTDRKFRVPREWSNDELAKFAPFFSGSVVNVSAWQDEDKQGRRYKDYFANAASYQITNFSSEARGFQGREDEIFLDLTAPLPAELAGRFDCVFNHTTLEHIFELDTAFANICAMSRDAVILVVPFVQQMHADYGDFWRFTPTCLARLFEKYGLTPIYSSFNNHFMASVYIFMIAVREPDRWSGKIAPGNGGPVPIAARPRFPDPFENLIGCNAVPSIWSGLAAALKGMIRGGTQSGSHRGHD